jgi:hypothetical protein
VVHSFTFDQFKAGDSQTVQSAIATCRDKGG